MNNVMRTIAASALLAWGGLAAQAADAGIPKTSYRYQKAGGVNIFYREAGSPARPTVVLLHGFPSSSHMYRDLIQKLAGRYHVVAPDFPGFGHSD